MKLIGGRRTRRPPPPPRDAIAFFGGVVWWECECECFNVGMIVVVIMVVMVVVIVVKLVTCLLCGMYGIVDWGVCILCQRVEVGGCQGSWVVTRSSGSAGNHHSTVCLSRLKRSGANLDFICDYVVGDWWGRWGS